LPSTSIDGSMLTLLSPYLLLPTDYIFNASREKYHQVGKIMIEFVWEYSLVHYDTFWMIDKEHGFFY
jgi:hypothetical protein